MAAPTQLQIETALKNAVDLIEETRKFAKDNAKNFIGMADAYIQSIKSDFYAAGVSSVQNARNSLAAIIGARPALLEEVIRAEGKRIKAPETALIAILGRMYDDFIANARTVKSRGFSFGTPTLTGTSVGDGEILRLNVDENAYDLENQTPDSVKKAKCIEDQSLGRRRNQELFTLEGGFAGIDILDIEGAGRVQTTTAKSSLDSPIDNPGFDSLEGTEAAPTAIPGWTVTTTAGAPLAVDSSNFTFDSANIALPKPDTATTVRALNIKALDARLEQKLVDKGVRLSNSRPRFLRVWWNRQVGAADGTLRIRMGSQTTTVVMAAQTGWQKLDMPIDKNLWYKNFRTEDATIRVERLTATTGAVLVDDVTFVEWEPFDGGWYLLLPGRTPFQRLDQLDWSDSIASDSKIQRALVEGMGIYLPHSGTPTIADPT